MSSPIAELLQNRVSIRAYTKEEVPADVLTEIFALAQRSPSSCNVQPWHSYVVSGEAKKSLQQKLIQEVMVKKTPTPDFDWQVNYQDVHRDRQFGSANALYTSMGIERSDKMGRNMAMLRNWQFFNAPHVVFFAMEKYLNMTAATDLGIYAQTLALLMQERGISSCMQGALGQFPEPVKQELGLGENESVLFGMSFGYADEKADVNKTKTDRASLEEAVKFIR